MSEFWQCVAIVVIGITAVVAKLVDMRMSRRDLTPAAATRYRILRRSIFITIIFVGLLSALLVIPQVRSVAAAILASSAVLGLVLGFAAQRTIGNFIAGLLIAFTQPRAARRRGRDRGRPRRRRGDRPHLHLGPDRRQRPARDTRTRSSCPRRVRNSTIRSPRTLAEVTVHVPLTADLRALLAALQRDSTEAYLTELAADATIAVRTWVPDQRLADRAESDLRLTVHDRLRELGIVAAA